MVYCDLGLYENGCQFLLATRQDNGPVQNKNNLQDAVGRAGSLNSATIGSSVFADANIVHAYIGEWESGTELGFGLAAT